MPTIEISDETYAQLQALAYPFEDTPDSVIARLLKLGDEEPPKVRAAPDAGIHRQRAQVGTLLPEKAYWVPILRALGERGGEAPAVNVINRVGELLAGELTEDDRGLTTSGERRWRNRVQFARLRMKELGWISPDSPRGIWALTDEGREQLHDARARRELE